MYTELAALGGAVTNDAPYLPPSVSWYDSQKYPWSPQLAPQLFLHSQAPVPPAVTMLSFHPTMTTAWLGRTLPL